MEPTTMVPLLRKQMADAKRAHAILSAARYELEQRDVAFLETYGPHEDGRIDFEFDGGVGLLDARRHLRTALDLVAEDDWEAHFEFPPGD